MRNRSSLRLLRLTCHEPNSVLGVLVKMRQLLVYATEKNVWEFVWKTPQKFRPLFRWKRNISFSFLTSKAFSLNWNCLRSCLTDGVEICLLLRFSLQVKVSKFFHHLWWNLQKKMSINSIRKCDSYPFKPFNRVRSLSSFFIQPQTTPILTAKPAAIKKLQFVSRLRFIILHLL